MTIRIIDLVWKEALHDRVATMLAILAVVIATAPVISQFAVLDAHDRTTDAALLERRSRIEAEMAALEEEYRELMLQLGLNMYIMPAEQDLHEYHEAGHATTFMPEEYVSRLASTDIITVRHLLPVIEQKVRWPEAGNRSILLVGTRGEVPFEDNPGDKPIILPVPKRHVVLGHELGASLRLSIGDTVTLLGRELIVHEIHGPRGTVDDITAWIHLSEVQDLLGLEGRINGIMALQCICVGGDIDSLNKQIPTILPGTKVVFFENEVTTRADARDRARKAAQASLQAEEQHRFLMRQELERTAVWLVPAVIAAGAALIAFVAVTNVAARRREIGILRAMGWRTRQILAVFLAKASVVGLAGAALGVTTGYAAAHLLSEAGIRINPFLFVAAFLGAPTLSVVVSWIPIFLGVSDDPATILGGGAAE